MLMCDSLLSWAASTDPFGSPSIPLLPSPSDNAAVTLQKITITPAPEEDRVCIPSSSSSVAVSRKLYVPSPTFGESMAAGLDGLSASSPATSATVVCEPQSIKVRSLSGQSWQMGVPNVASSLRGGTSSQSQGGDGQSPSGPSLHRVTSALTSMPLKARCLAQAAARIVEHIVAVGACDDPRCLMFFDPEVFSRPAAIASRLRVESFRRKTASSSHSALASLPSPQHHHHAAVASESATTTTDRNSQRTDDMESLACDDTHLPAPEEDFDLKHISKKLLSSSAQQSTPLREFLADCLHVLSSPSSPIRCSPETFAFALVLFERVQHCYLLSKTTSHHHVSSTHPLGRGAGSPPQQPPLCGPPSARSGTTTPIATVSEDRVRSFIDETSTARLTVENLQRLQQHSVVGVHPPHPQGGGGVGAAQQPLQSTMTTTFVNTNATVPFGFASPFVARSRTPTARTTSDSESAMPTLCPSCLECDASADGGLAIHASNAHIFFAAAVVVAIKVREDDAARNPKVLALVASALHCSSTRALFLAERCLCDALHFDIDVTVSDYRTMLHQLAAQRSEAAAAVAASDATVAVAAAAADCTTTSSAPLSTPSTVAVQSNYMTLFAMV